jgi:hypothetical protein
MTEPTPDFALLQLFVIVVGVAGVVGSAVLHGRHELGKEPLNCRFKMPPDKRRERSRYMRIQAAATIMMWVFLIVTFAAVATLFGASAKF